MKPQRTPTTNLNLVLRDQNGERNPNSDLPAERCVDQAGRQIIETAWAPDEGELRALVNGAPILLRVWGTGHPPVNLEAGHPAPEGSGVLLGAHVNRALGFLFAELADRSGSPNKETIDLLNGSHVTADWFISRFHAALLHTAINPQDQ